MFVIVVIVNNDFTKKAVLIRTTLLQGYLEELVRLRESQLEDAHKQRQKLVDTIQNFEGESRKERQQLEGIIIELQAQL